MTYNHHAALLLQGAQTRHQLSDAQASPLPPLEERLLPNASPLVISHRGDPTASYFYSTCRQLGSPVSWITTCDVMTGQISINLFATIVCGSRGVYCRPLGNETHTYAVSSAMRALCILNKNLIDCDPENSNWSKPYHSARIAPVAAIFGGQTPETWVTNRPKMNSIVKAMGIFPSYTYDINDEIDARDWLFMAQERVEGLEKRVHVVGNKCFVHDVHHDSTDYRLDRSAAISPSTIDDKWQQACVALARSERLRFAGIDLFQSKNTVFFIEVNPMPGYDGFEKACQIGAPITSALLNLLEGSP